MQSEQVNEIASALANAQSKMGGAKKDANNPFFHSKYATLSSVIDAISGPLSENKLSYWQGPFYNVAAQTWVVSTTLMHDSGQWISTEYPVLYEKSGPQPFGAGYSYARRFALMGIAGIPAVDDDGISASDQTGEFSIPPIMRAQNSLDNFTITEPMGRRMYAIWKSSGWSDEQAKKLLGDYGYSGTKDVKKKDYEALCNAFALSPESDVEGFFNGPDAA